MTIALITPADAAKNYGRRLSYVYKLACIHGWKRLRYDGRVYYDQDQVDAVLGRD